MSRVRRIVSPFAPALRREQTDAERRLWFAFRDRRFLGHKIRRQHCIGPYIADFACIGSKLVIELDGGQHGDAVAYDERRTGFMNADGWHVLRFWNSEVFANLDGVLTVIADELIARGDGHSHPGPRL